MSLITYIRAKVLRETKTHDVRHFSKKVPPLKAELQLQLLLWICNGLCQQVISVLGIITEGLEPPLISSPRLCPTLIVYVKD